LKIIHLKHYFKYPGVFHSPVEKPVENFKIVAQKRGKRVNLQHLPALHSRKCLSGAKVNACMDS
jgi:hypothetical protein